MFQPPANLRETKVMNGCTYHWCTKCNRSNGQWVQAHTTNTHLDDFKPKPRTTGGQRRPGSGRQQQMPPPSILCDPKDRQTKVSFAQTPPSTVTPPVTTAQLSLVDAVTDCFHFDVQDLLESEPWRLEQFHPPLASRLAYAPHPVHPCILSCCFYPS